MLSTITLHPDGTERVNCVDLHPATDNATVAVNIERNGDCLTLIGTPEQLQTILARAVGEVGRVLRNRDFERGIARERPVPCLDCNRMTWNGSAVCDECELVTELKAG